MVISITVSQQAATTWVSVPILKILKKKSVWPYTLLYENISLKFVFGCICVHTYSLLAFTTPLWHPNEQSTGYKFHLLFPFLFIFLHHPGSFANMCQCLWLIKQFWLNKWGRYFSLSTKSHFKFRLNDSYDNNSNKTKAQCATCWVKS